MRCSRMPLRYHDRMGYSKPYAKLSRHFVRVGESAVSNLLPFRKTRRSVLLTASLASLAVGVAAVGVFVGRELRIRYKFNHRKPADFFAHAGDELPADYGMGI
jgi:hypothetical protein